ncbi:MAG: zinc-binding dehydrogenase [Patulibacter sp.]|nr:zinc-binding dehydrogenase [Patulibacter sp.]
MKVRSAVLRTAAAARPYDDSQPLRWETLELAEPGPGEVRVKVRAAGLCHSDLSTINGSRLRPTPMAIGHEAAGEIVALGPGVTDRRIGEPVVLTFVPTCGSCEFCAEGRPALCGPGAAANGAGELLAGGRRLRTTTGAPGERHGSPAANADPGPPEEVHHHLGVSAFSEHVVVSTRSVVPIDPELPWEIAALFGCAVLTGVGAVVNAARVTPGESVAIFGLGGVGLAALLGAVAAGAQPIVAVDRVPEKLALARELGATTVIAADEGVDVATAIRDATGGGVHHAIETVGSAAVLAQAYAATRRAGQTTTVGLPDPSAQLQIPAVTITAEERTIRGSYLGSCVPQRDIPRFVALYRAGRLPVDRLLSHRLAPDQINAGFERLAAGEGVRQVVVFPETTS